MKDEKKFINKEDIQPIILSILALLVVIGIGFVTYNLLFGEKDAPKEVNVSKIEGFGKTPEEAVAKFIMTAGNMGNPEDVTFEKLDNKSSRQNNGQRRLDSYEKASEGLVSGSQHLIPNQKDYIAAYAQQLNASEYYTVLADSVEVGKHSYGEEIEIDNKGKINSYQTAKVKANFISTKASFQLARTDADSDGSYSRINNEEGFKNVEFTVVKVGDSAWRIYEFDQYVEIGERFSTWDTQSEITLDFSKDKEVATFKPNK